MSSDSSFQGALDALLIGDLGAMTRSLDEQPDLVHARCAEPAQATLLHYTSFNGLPELTFAAPKATPAIARLLIERGAEVDAQAFGSPTATPISWALSSWLTCMGGVQLELCAAYLDGGAEIDGVHGEGAPIGHAIGFGYRSAVEYLAERGADCDNLPAACALGRLESMQAWFDGSRFSDECMGHTQSDKSERGRFSWPPPCGADPMTMALVTASTHGRLPLVEWLLEQGADPNGDVSFGQTPLHYAAYIGYPEVVRLLLERGADPTRVERQFGRSPAQWARETGEEALAQLLESC